MTTVQIIGAILSTASLIGAAMLGSMWIHQRTLIRREQIISDREEKKARIAVSERLAKEALCKMYEQEHDMRIAAETKLGIREDKIKRQDKEIKRLKGLLADAEGKK